MLTSNVQIDCPPFRFVFWFFGPFVSNKCPSFCIVFWNFGGREITKAFLQLMSLQTLVVRRMCLYNVALSGKVL